MPGERSATVFVTCTRCHNDLTVVTPCRFRICQAVAIMATVKCCLASLCPFVEDLFAASIALLGKCSASRGIIRQVNIPSRFTGSCYFHALHGPARVILYLKYDGMEQSYGVHEDGQLAFHA